MKILAIGNSFSEDGTAYIERIAESAGITDIVAANLYIGGCPLSRHAENLKTNAPDYDYQRHAKGLYKSNIRDAVLSDKWDIITMQQVSGYSGKPESFQPYFDEVYKEVRALCPDATLIFLLPPTWEDLEERIHDGKIKSEEEIAERLFIAQEEVLCAGQYDYILINDTVEDTVRRLGQIIHGNRYSKNSMKSFLKSYIESEIKSEMVEAICEE